MTEITHEALNEIADALRRGCDGSIPIEAAEKLECIADALRTGQLVHAVPSEDGPEAAAHIQALETSLAEAEGRVIAEVVAWLRATWIKDDACIWNEVATALETGEWKK